jgi:cytoskeletal protein CcmA (bactofilin family)
MWKSDEQTAATIPTSNAAVPARPASNAAVPPRPDANEAPPIACIGKSVVIKGDVIGAEDLTIDGQVEGRIELLNHHLTVGVGAAIKAEVIVGTLTLRGAVTGNITASEAVHLRETGSVDGDISVPRLAMSDGAVLCGKVYTRPANNAAHAD